MSIQKKNSQNKDTRFLFENENYAVTPVENAFINIFMPKANGDYVKVYLYGLKACYAKDAVPVDNVTLAQELGITEGDVRRAWDYWQAQGVLNVSYDADGRASVTYYNVFSVIMGDDKSHRQRAPKDAAPVEAKPAAPVSADDERVAAMFDRIQLMFGSDTLSLTSVETISHYLTEDGFAPEAILLLIEHSINALAAKNGEFSQRQVLRYADTIAKSWAARGVVTYEQAQAALTSDSAKQKRYYRILKVLGLTRNPMQRERDIIDRWFDEWAFDTAVVAEALRRTTKPSLDYTNGILKRWHDKGLKTLDAVQAEAAAFKEHQQKKTAPQDSDDLEDTRNREKMLDEAYDESIDAIWRSVDAKQ